jgi:peptidoglycan/xylan/chitin deacetylase (PgdA/CDA1 family)
MLTTARSLAKTGKTALLHLARGSGIFEHVADSDWRRSRLLILCYHGVSLSDEHEWDPELFVTADFLRRRFQILRDQNYSVLPLGQAIEQLQKQTLPRRAVAITFDDGFFNFYAAAAPLLKEFGLPATNYVSSYHCLHQRPILRLTLRYLLWKARSKSLRAHTLPGQSTPIDLSDRPGREALAQILVDKARTLCVDRNAQLDWVGGIARQLDIDWSAFLDNRLFHLMTQDEIASIAGNGIDIQLHTHRHRTPRAEGAFREEITENRRIIEQQTGSPAEHFCYPSGDYDAVFLPWLRSLNVVSATTCEVGLATSNHDRLLLPRFIDTMLQSELSFESWLSGAAELIRPNRQ